MRILVGTAALAALFVAPAHAASPPAMTEVVVTLDAPPLATAVRQSRVLTARVRTARLDLASPSSAGYLRSLATAQRQLAARITTTIPQASVTWRYQVVLNGLAVSLPRADLARLARHPASRRSGRTSPTGRSSTGARS